MRLALFILAASFAGLAARASAGEPGPARRETSANEKEKDALYSKIDSVVGLKTIETASVSKALGLALAFKKVSESPSYRCFEARPAQEAFDRVEVRSPRGEARGGLVILELAGGLRLRPSDVGARFGEDFGIKGPNARQQKGSPYFHVYKRPNGQLKFGFSPVDDPYLVKVIWDRDHQCFPAEKVAIVVDTKSEVEARFKHAISAGSLKIDYTVTNRTKDPVFVLDRMWDRETKRIERDWAYARVAGKTLTVRRASDKPPVGLLIEEPRLPYGRLLGPGQSLTGSIRLPLPLKQGGEYDHFPRRRPTKTVGIEKLDLEIGWCKKADADVPDEARVDLEGEPLWFLGQTAIECQRICSRSSHQRQADRRGRRPLGVLIALSWEIPVPLNQDKNNVPENSRASYICTRRVIARLFAWSGGLRTDQEECLC